MFIGPLPIARPPDKKHLGNSGWLSRAVKNTGVASAGTRRRPPTKSPNEEGRCMHAALAGSTSESEARMCVRVGSPKGRHKWPQGHK